MRRNSKNGEKQIWCASNYSCPSSTLTADPLTRCSLHRNHHSTRFHKNKSASYSVLRWGPQIPKTPQGQEEQSPCKATPNPAALTLTWHSPLDNCLSHSALCIWERNHSQNVTSAREEGTCRNWYTLLPSLSPHCADISYLRKDATESKTLHCLMWLQNSLNITSRNKVQFDNIPDKSFQLISQIYRALKQNWLFSSWKKSLLFCSVVLHSCFPVPSQAHSTSLS